MLVLNQTLAGYEELWLCSHSHAWYGESYHSHLSPDIIALPVIFPAASADRETNSPDRTSTRALEIIEECVWWQQHGRELLLGGSVHIPSQPGSHFPWQRAPLPSSLQHASSVCYCLNCRQTSGGNATSCWSAFWLSRFISPLSTG